MWERIVDTYVEYHFETEMAQRFERRNVSAAGGVPLPSGAGRPRSQIRYLSSQYLGRRADRGEGHGIKAHLASSPSSLNGRDRRPTADSSLSQSMSLVAATPMDLDERPAAPPAAPAAAAAAEASAPVAAAPEPAAVVLEMDALNRNPSMATLLRVLDRLHTEVSPPRPRSGGGPPDMPPWMTEIHALMTSEATHINVRLFLAKVGVRPAPR